MAYDFTIELEIQYGVRTSIEYSSIVILIDLLFKDGSSNLNYITWALDPYNLPLR